MQKIAPADRIYPALTGLDLSPAGLRAVTRKCSGLGLREVGADAGCENIRFTRGVITHAMP